MTQLALPRPTSRRRCSTRSATRRSCGSRTSAPGSPPQLRGEGRVPEPGRLDQGPPGARDDRAGRARGEAAPRRDDRRADVGQHRHGARDRRAAEGLPRDRGDAGQDEQGEDRPAARLRRRGRGHADRRRARLAGVLLPRRRPADRGDPRRLPAQPVLQPGEPRRALRVDRARAVGAVRRADHAPRRGRGDRRHDHRHRALPEGAEPADPGDRRRPGRLDLLRRRGRRAAVSRRGRGRGLLAADLRPFGGRSLRRGQRQGVVPGHAPAGDGGGHPGGRLVRHRDPRGARRRRRRSRTRRR